jgi:multidrug efflux system outer membrane protein
MPRPRRFVAAALLAGLCGCDLAPHYVPPDLRIPASYKGSGTWQVGHPADTLPRAAWWRMYGNPILDALEPQVQANNPDLAATVQVLEQARDLTVEAEYGLFPAVSVGGSFTANRQSEHRPLRRPGQPNYYGANTLDAAAQWEVDIWEEITNAVRAQKRSAQAAAANVASVTLSLQAELADDYIALRGLDQELAILASAIAYYQSGVEITRLRLAHKIASALDVDQAENQLAAAQAQVSNLHGRRELLEHAIADLLGLSASSFSLPPQGREPLLLPNVAVGLPSGLLQRRPDIAEAERQMAAANAFIGVARASFYPNIVLSAAGGFQDTGLALVSLPNSLWSVGTAIALPVFEGGLRRAVLARSRAAYEQTRDQYRAVVLAGFQDVEDQLSLLHWLAEEARQQQVAARSALAAQRLSLQLYTGGAASYVDVVVQEGYALTAQLAELQAETSRLTTSVSLVRALGGGWTTRDLPNSRQIVPFSPFP